MIFLDKANLKNVLSQQYKNTYSNQSGVTTWNFFLIKSHYFINFTLKHLNIVSILSLFYGVYQVCGRGLEISWSQCQKVWSQIERFLQTKLWHLGMAHFPHIANKKKTNVIIFYIRQLILTCLLWLLQIINDSFLSPGATVR